MVSMGNTELFHKISALLLVITGIMHLLTPLVYQSMDMNVVSFVLFGVIYLALGILLILKEDQKIIALLSIIFPLIGLIGGTVILITTFSVYLLIMLIIDPIIIILRILVLKEM